MIKLLENVFAQKASVRIVVRLSLLPFAQEHLFRRIYLFAVRGFFNAGSGQSIEIFAEGPKPRLERLIEFLRKEASLGGAKSLEVTWRPFRGEYDDFRAAAKTTGGCGYAIDL